MPVTTERPPAATPIRPFDKIEFPEAALEELRARIKATRWPEKEPVEDHSQGVPFSTMQAVARYWLKEYDWRKCEAERPPAFHHRDRRAGYPFHSRAVET